jgi:hypothetical protein
LPRAEAQAPVQASALASAPALASALGAEGEPQFVDLALPVNWAEVVSECRGAGGRHIGVVDSFATAVIAEALALAMDACKLAARAGKAAAKALWRVLKLVALTAAHAPLAALCLAAPWRFFELALSRRERRVQRVELRREPSSRGLRRVEARLQRLAGLKGVVVPIAINLLGALDHFAGIFHIVVQFPDFLCLHRSTLSSCEFRSHSPAAARRP